MSILQSVARHLSDLHERIPQSGNDEWLFEFARRLFHHVLEVGPPRALRPEERLVDLARLLFALQLLA